MGEFRGSGSGWTLACRIYPAAILYPVQMNRRLGRLEELPQLTADSGAARPNPLALEFCHGHKYPMYNLLVAFDPKAWKNGVYEFQRERVAVEYTEDSISERYKDLNAEVSELPLSHSTAIRGFTPRPVKIFAR